jgi:hypothetical protein
MSSALFIGKGYWVNDGDTLHFFAKLRNRLLVEGQEQFVWKAKKLLNIAKILVPGTAYQAVCYNLSIIPNCIMIHIKYSVIASLVIMVLGAGVGLIASASPFESIPSAVYKSIDNGLLGAQVDSWHKVVTVSPRYEYRSFYWYATTTPPWVWTPVAYWSEWNEFSECREQGTVNPSGVIDICNTTSTLPVLRANTYLWQRSTTNRQLIPAGCLSTFTPTPDVANCGDYRQGYKFHP